MKTEFYHRSLGDIVKIKLNEIDFHNPYNEIEATVKIIAINARITQNDVIEIYYEGIQGAMDSFEFYESDIIKINQ